MAQEIERKFLVTGPFPQGDASDIVQAYLNLDPERTVRVRIESGRGSINVKGLARGITRAEFEYPIPLADARALVEMAVGCAIEKTRHRVTHGGHVWEIDVFRGANDGLVVAEIELASEAETFERPDWLGEEVTADFRFANLSLATRPFSTWQAAP